MTEDWLLRSRSNLQATAVDKQPPFLTESHFGGRKAFLKLAPEVGLEPTTLRLTAECSTIELLRSAGRTAQRNGNDYIGGGWIRQEWIKGGKAWISAFCIPLCDAAPEFSSMEAELLLVMRF